jgi:hypothetical protein
MIQLKNFNKTSYPLSLTSVKHGLLILDREHGSLYLLDTQDLARLLSEPLAILVHTFQPHTLESSYYTFDIKEARNTNGNLLLLNIRNPQNGEESF